jgi:hypothetical protein
MPYAWQSLFFFFVFKGLRWEVVFHFFLLILVEFLTTTVKTRLANWPAWRVTPAKTPYHLPPIMTRGGSLFSPPQNHPPKMDAEWAKKDNSNYLYDTYIIAGCIKTYQPHWAYKWHVISICYRIFVFVKHMLCFK